MNRRMLVFLLIGFCLTSWTLVEYAEARGGRGGGGGGFSRGGGGRGGGSFGSIRNSGRASSGNFSRFSTREISSPAGRDISRPSTRDISRPSQVQVSDRLAEQRPAVGDRFSQGFPSQLPAGSGARLSQQPSGQRGQNLTAAQKDQLRQKYQENGGLKPSQLPARDPGQSREDRQNWRDQNREDWQNQMNQSRENWQDWYEDEYHDHWDDHWYSPWWYGYPVSAVSFSFYIDDTPPCQKTVVINQATGSTTYYYCNSLWYQPAYSSGEVKYIVTAPPAGAEMTSIADPYKVTVGGQDYYVSNHVFYQKITRNGQTLYMTVDAPPGARIPTIPEYAVEIEHQGQRYYRFDKIFYSRQGESFVVVKNPGV